MWYTYQSWTISSQRVQHTKSDNHKCEQQLKDWNSPYVVTHITTKTHKLAKFITHIADNHYDIEHPRCFCASFHSMESDFRSIIQKWLKWLHDNLGWWHFSLSLSQTHTHTHTHTQLNSSPMLLGRKCYNSLPVIQTSVHMTRIWFPPLTQTPQKKLFANRDDIWTAAWNEVAWISMPGDADKCSPPSPSLSTNCGQSRGCH